jgi:hypothetical protein
MKAPLIAMGLGVLTVLAILLVPKLVSNEGKDQSARITACIARLTGSDSAVSKRTEEELGAIGGPALGLLEEALEASTDTQHKQQLREALNRLAIHRPGGPVVDGFKIALRADKDKIRPFEPVKLTTTFANMTERPMVVFSAWTHGTAQAVRVWGLWPAISAARDFRETPPQEAPGCCQYVCGSWNGILVNSCLYQVFEVIPPRRAVEFVSVVHHRTKERLSDQGIPQQKEPSWFEAPIPGTCRLRVIHELGPKYSDPTNSGRPPLPADARVWIGTAHSNEVAIEVLLAVEPGAN